MLIISKKFIIIENYLLNIFIKIKNNINFKEIAINYKYFFKFYNILMTKKSKIIFIIGSNLGNRAENIEKATLLLKRKIFLENIKISKIYENKALLKPNSPKEWDIDFYNLALSANFDTEKFNPQEILKIIKDIEISIGRNDAVKKTWSPRKIDIDIAAIDNLVYTEEDLVIPHHSLLQRDFFLKTFSEIEPEWQYPVKGRFFLKKIIDIYKTFQEENPI